MNDSLSMILKRISVDIYKQYAISIKGTKTIVVPEVTISDEEVFAILTKDKELTKHIYKGKYLSFWKTSKRPLEHVLPIDIVYHITHYIPRITYQMVTYCKWCLLDHTERQILDVIHEHKFDMMWYTYDSLDYRWCKDSITEATTHLKKVENDKKSFLKHSRYKTPLTP